MPIQIPVAAIAQRAIANTVAVDSPWIPIHALYEKQFTVMAYRSTNVATQPLQCEVWLASQNIPIATVPLVVGQTNFNWPAGITGYVLGMFAEELGQQGFGVAGALNANWWDTFFGIWRTIIYRGPPIGAGFAITPGDLCAAAIVVYAGTLTLDVLQKALLGTPTIITPLNLSPEAPLNVPIPFTTHANFAKLRIKCPTWATGAWVVSATFEGRGAR